MREGKALILATKPFAQEIRWRSWFHLLSTLFILLALFTGTLINVHLIGKMVCSILTGLVLVRMFIIYHDHQHHSILYKSMPANIIMTLFGLYILAPSSIWKRSHDYHHAHNSKLFSASIGSYPIYTKEKYLSLSRGEQNSYLAVRHPLTIAFGYFTMFIYGMCTMSFISSPKKHYDSMISLALHFGLAAFIVVYFGWIAMILSVIVPFFIACALGAYLFYAQHNFPGVTFKKNVEWSYEHAALESSSYMKMNPVWEWLTGNIGYHHIHHINARIPFYRLPEAMEKIPELQNAKVTSLWPSDIWQCLKLKVWDQEANCMIPLSAL